MDVQETDEIKHTIEKADTNNIFAKIFSVKNVLLFRLITWGIGIICLIISYAVFKHQNRPLWNFTKTYNKLLFYITCLPIGLSTISVHIALNITQGGTIRKTLLYIFSLALLPICYLIWVVTFVCCTGGI